MSKYCLLCGLIFIGISFDSFTQERYYHAKDFPSKNRITYIPNASSFEKKVFRGSNDLDTFRLRLDFGTHEKRVDHNLNLLMGYTHFLELVQMFNFSYEKFKIEWAIFHKSLNITYLESPLTNPSPFIIQTCTVLEETQFWGNEIPKILIRNSSFGTVRFNNYSNKGKSLTIEETNFSGPVYFEGTTFERIELNKNTFNHYFLLRGGREYISASFFRCQFNSESFFNYQSLKGVIKFDGCNFGGRLDFSSTDIDSTGKIIFHNVAFPDTLDFSGIHFPIQIDFLDSPFDSERRMEKKTKRYNLDSRHVINLIGSNISNYSLDYQHFRLQTEIHENWKRSKPKVVSGKIDVSNAYEQLKENFRKNNQPYDYMLVDIEHRNYLLSKGDWLNFFPLIWHNYGYDKSRILWWTLGSLLIFSIYPFYNLARLNDPNKGVYNIKQIPRITHKDSIPIRYFYAFIWTAYLFFPLSLGIQRLRLDKGIDTWFVFFVYCWGLLCVGYLANFIVTT